MPPPPGFLGLLRLLGMAQTSLFFAPTAPKKRGRVCYRRGSQAQHTAFPPQDVMPEHGSNKRELLITASRLLHRHVTRRNSRQLPGSPQESRNKTPNLPSPLALGIPSQPTGPPPTPRDTPPGSCGGGPLTEGAFPVSPQSEWTAPPVKRWFPVRLQHGVSQSRGLWVPAEEVTFPISPVGLDAIAGEAPPVEVIRGGKQEASVVPAPSFHTLSLFKKVCSSGAFPR